MSSLVSELKRRGVLKVAAAYALASWILIEAGSVLLPTFGAPEWIFRSYVIFVLLGFVVSLIASWIFKITPEGVQLEVRADAVTHPATAKPGSRKLNFVLIAMLLVALGISLSLNLSGRGSIVQESVADDAFSIAVLPFTDHSNDPANAIFVDGMHDDLLTKLANVGSMRVISRTSVLAYRNTTKNMREIGEELGAGTILEGAVQRIGNNVRINMQLIDADTDEHLWAETYDRELTAKNIFDIQSEISTQIATAMKATLSPGEWDRMTAVPTENIDAYRLVIAGRQNLHQRLYETIVIARDQFEQAIALDPNYADAYVGQADSIMLLNINHLAIPADQAFLEAQAAIDMALRLNPQHADAFATQGLILMTKARINSDQRAFSDAEANYKKSLALNPSNARAWMWYSSLSEQQQEFAKAIEYNRKSLVLDPVGRIPYLNIAKLQSGLGNNELAVQEFLKGINIHPEWPSLYIGLSNHLQRLGRLDEAVAWSRLGAEKDNGFFKKLTLIGVFFELEMQEETEQAITKISPTNPAKGVFDAYALVIENQEDAAMLSIEASYAGQENSFPNIAGTMAGIALLADDLERIEKYALHQIPYLADEDIDLNPMQAATALKMAYVWGKRGEVERAQKMLQKVLLAVSTRPRMGIAGHGIVDVQTLALLGRPEEAMRAFKQAVGEGYLSSLSFDGWPLSKDPYLQSIRNHFEYQAQIEIIEQKKSRMRSNVQVALSSNDFQPLRNLAGDN